MDGSGAFGITSTLLPDGDVLADGIEAPVSAELYDPSSATWSRTGQTVGTHYSATATLLPDGDVLIAGDGTTAAALYDPTTNTWAQTGSMNVARYHPTATLLEDGQVLVAGGSPTNGGPAITTAELYDPESGDWTLTEGSLPTGRYGGAATLLVDGEVLIAGGCTSGCGPYNSSTLLYEGGFFDYGPPMTVPRLYNTATLMANGNVLVTGGETTSCCAVLSKAEVYTSTTLAVSPSSGPPGQKITVSGAGFYAGERVDVTVDSVTTIGFATTNSTGTFVLNAQIPSSEPPGVHTIRADGERSFTVGQTSFNAT
jgi:hypothetical protein